MRTSKRIGVIDIGSNSVRLVIYEKLTSSSHRIIDESKETARLSSHIAQDGSIPLDFIMSIIEILNHFKRLCAVHYTDEIRAVATAAIRNASNRQQIITLLKKHSGLDIKVISGEDEARYGYIGVVNTIDVKDTFIIDIGGGSTEITLVKNRQLLHSVSLPIGAVNTATRYSSQGTLTAENIAIITKNVQQSLKQHPWMLHHRGFGVIGLGGTFRTIAKMNQQRTQYSLDSTHHYTMHPHVLNQLYAMLEPLALDQLKKINGLSKDRADIIKSGMVVLRTIIDYLQASSITISGSGLRDGIFFEAVKPNQPILPDVLEYSIQNLLALNPYASKKHLEQVNHLALKLFSGLAEAFTIPTSYQKYVHTASLLYRLGVSVHYYQYQKHTFYMMTHSRIDGLSHREILLCALIASYKSKSHCKKLAAAYRDLVSQHDLQIAMKLGSMLQLAIALDRSETQPISNLEIEFVQNEMKLSLQTTHSIAIERKALEAVEKDFRKAWGLTISINEYQLT